MTLEIVTIYQIQPSGMPLGMPLVARPRRWAALQLPCPDVRGGLTWRTARGMRNAVRKARRTRVKVCSVY